MYPKVLCNLRGIKDSIISLKLNKDKLNKEERQVYNILKNIIITSKESGIKFTRINKSQSFFRT